MKKTTSITHLFLDVGGVLLTNGWDHHERKKAAAHFKLDWAEIEERHKLIFEPYEEDKFTLEEYLNLVIFYKKRSFTKVQYRRFMFDQSKSYPKMIDWVCRLKAQYGLKIVVISNEARELNKHRILKFKLDSFVDIFISSSFVHIRKPETQIYRLALDISQAQAEQVVYIENTPMYVQIAEGLGIRSILHTDYSSTSKKFASLMKNSEKKLNHA